MPGPIRARPDRAAAPPLRRPRAAAKPAAPVASGPAPPEADAASLLVWYDRHRRELPWRARPGEPADPYRVWLSEVMLQQTTIAAVRPYYARFLALFPNVAALAAAPAEAVMSAWAGLGYYSRARNLHACARAVAAAGGDFPSSEAGLRRLPGIGAYTAAAIAAIAFGEAAAAVDGNVERVISRVYRVDAPLPAAKPAIHALTAALVPPARPGDFAQAVMDLGATICTPKRPACAICPWMGPCRARAAGLQETYPRKLPKREGVLRRGAAFVALRADGAVLLRTRPPKGLLGGMAEVPGPEWRADYDPGFAVLDAPMEARWRRLPGAVTHVFTHFPLELAVLFAKVGRGTPAPDGMRWVAGEDLAAEPLPNVMKKVLALAGLDGTTQPSVTRVSGSAASGRPPPRRSRSPGG